jgi:hypothetical protein
VALKISSTVCSSMGEMQGFAEQEAEW